MIHSRLTKQDELEWGHPIGQADAAMVLLHGRGSSSSDIKELATLFHSDRFAFIAPGAEGGAWYPYSFLSPIARNEPYLSRSLARIKVLLERIRASGITPSRTMLLGFSQGACLALEFTAREPGNYAAVVGLSGGLIGPPGTAWQTKGRADALTVFLGCGEPDPHIPIERVEQTARFFTSTGARVEKRIYPGLGHSINQDEIEQVKKLMSGILG